MPLVIEHEFTWKIPGFLHLKENIYSPHFHANPYTEFTWVLFINPVSEGSAGVETVSVTLVDLSWKYSTAHRMEVSVPSVGRPQGLPITVVSTWGSRWTMDDVTRRFVTELVPREHLVSKQYQYLDEGALTLVCKLRIVTAPYVLQLKAATDDEEPRRQPVDDVECNMDEDAPSDVILCTGDHVFCAHQTVLMVHSSVFVAMFHDPEGLRHKCHVDLQDLSYDVLHEVLLFIYTGKHPGEGRVTNELLLAAEKFKLAHLKTTCESALASRITSETAVDLYSVAQRSNAKQLKSCVLDFIIRHNTEVSFKCTDEQRALLLSEIFQAMLLTE